MGPFQFLGILSPNMLFGILIKALQRFFQYLWGHVSSAGDGATLQDLQRLHQHLWGENVINVVQEHGKSYAVIDTLLFKIRQKVSLACHRTGHTILVRQEYILAYDMICDTIQQKRNPDPLVSQAGCAFLITGQPGIGASQFSDHLMKPELIYIKNRKNIISALHFSPSTRRTATRSSTDVFGYICLL